ncbi:MAG: secretion protein EccK [Mycobacterium sp.]|nr:secretion protein EccK [Mycobacterium sp.]
MTGPAVSPAAAAPGAGSTLAAGPVPVTAARAEREAVLQAVNAEASSARRGGAADPLTLAIRIAAALNAQDRPERHVPNFFWATGLTTDGRILVANSFGMGYLPAGQNLPEQVCFVSLDDSVPLATRVSWSTRPWLALAGWAQAQGVELRAVIGTKDQLDRVDVGASHQVLENDDIPQTSQMVGRDRLAMIAPEHAGHLAATTDRALVKLLPAAPASALSPEDRSADLWFAVMAPMMSEAEGREIAQLQALLAYADHQEERAIYAGHTAADPVAQRAAIADGLYWHYLAALTDRALSVGQPVQ